MQITVEPTRILIGTPDFVPRFLDLPKVLQVPAGQTVTLAPDSTWDYVEVAGTLHVPRAQATILRTTHLFVLPGGFLDCGSETDPMTAPVEIILRDVPIDTTRDPFQWGNGLLNFGRREICGVIKRPWTTATGDLAAGATTLTLSEDPDGWAVGDMLLLTDTRQTIYPDRPRREASLTILAIAGRQITISAPLAFAHLTIKDLAGHPVLLPRVANLTRNVVIRSEHPAGTRGHFADIGHMAMWCDCGLETRALGRTKIGRLNNVNPTTLQPGTNQVGRYNAHKHHAMGFGSLTHHCVFTGDPGGGKWGIALHNTHDALVEWNISDGFPGAGFVTEDGCETRNVFKKNLAVYAWGGNHNGNANIEDANAQADASGAVAPGSASNGFWFRGIQNTFDGNEAWCNPIGFNLFNFRPVLGFFPSVPGGDPDTPFNHFAAEPVVHTGTVAAISTVDNVEYWGGPTTPAIDMVSALPGIFGLFAGLSDDSSVHLVNPTFLGVGAAFGIESQVAYTNVLRLTGGAIEGFATGCQGGGHNNYLTGIRLQNTLDIEWSNYPDTAALVDLPGKPTIKLGTAAVWNGTPPIPDTGISRFIQQRGSQFTIKNWNGTDQDFRLFILQQLASTAAWPAAYHYPDFWGSPEVGLTMGESWAKDGIAFLGEAVTNPVPLEGLLVGLAAPGLKAILGPPQAIVTLPNARDAVPATGFDAFLLVTGDPTQASELVLVSVDGDPPLTSLPPEQGGRDARSLHIATHLTEGAHTLTTWRTTAAGQAIPASKRVFPYHIGSVVPPPQVTVPPLVGLQQSVASTTLTAAGLQLGMQTNVTDAAPLREVIAQSPAAGTQVAPGSSVAITVSLGPAPVDVWHAVTATLQQFGTQKQLRYVLADGTTIELVVKP